MGKVNHGVWPPDSLPCRAKHPHERKSLLKIILKIKEGYSFLRVAALKIKLKVKLKIKTKGHFLCGSWGLTPWFIQPVVFLGFLPCWECCFPEESDDMSGWKYLGVQFTLSSSKGSQGFSHAHSIRATAPFSTRGFEWFLFLCQDFSKWGQTPFVISHEGD